MRFDPFGASKSMNYPRIYDGSSIITPQIHPIAELAEL